MEAQEIVLAISDVTGVKSANFNPNEGNGSMTIRVNGQFKMGNTNEIIKIVASYCGDWKLISAQGSLSFIKLTIQK